MPYSRAQRLDILLGLIFSLAITALGLAAAWNRVRAADSRPAILSGCGTEDLDARIVDVLATSSRFVAVIGDGVPGESLVIDRPYNTQFAQGYDMYQGVSHAMLLPKLLAMRNKVGILFLDDGGNPACAAHIAETLSQQPALLGVIGHSTTSTTAAALPFYRRSYVPVLMPVATNPQILRDSDTHAFRLPANDEVQALVVADLIVTHLKGGTVFIIWDATPEAVQYSEYISRTVQHFLAADTLRVPDAAPTVVEGTYPISLNPLNYSYLFRRIVSSDPAAVVFIGYGSLAREFIFGLDYEYALHPQRTRPKLILTDGCKIPGIKALGFDAYLTFPAGQLTGLPQFAHFTGGDRMAPFERMYLEESFEVFGYDATVLFMSAVQKLFEKKRVLSRQTVLAELRSNANVAPTAYSYGFLRGENSRAGYYVYSLAKSTVEFSYNESAIQNLRQRMADKQ